MDQIEKIDIERDKNTLSLTMQLRSHYSIELTYVATHKDNLDKVTCEMGARMSKHNAIEDHVQQMYQFLDKMIHQGVVRSYQYSRTNLVWDTDNARYTQSSSAFPNGEVYMTVFNIDWTVRGAGPPTIAAKYDVECGSALMTSDYFESSDMLQGKHRVVHLASGVICFHFHLAELLRDIELMIGARYQTMGFIIHSNLMARVCSEIKWRLKRALALEDKLLELHRFLENSHRAGMVLAFKQQRVNLKLCNDAWVNSRSVYPESDAYMIAFQIIWNPRINGPLVVSICLTYDATDSVFKTENYFQVCQRVWHGRTIIGQTGTTVCIHSTLIGLLYDISQRIESGL